MGNGFFDSYRVSAKEDINIAAAFSGLTREMIIAAIAQQQREDEQFEDEAADMRAASFRIDPKSNVKVREKKKKNCKC